MSNQVTMHFNTIDDKHINLRGKKVLFTRGISYKGLRAESSYLKGYGKRKMARKLPSNYYRDSYYKMRIEDIKASRSRRLARQQQATYKQYRARQGLYATFLFKIFFTVLPLIVVGVMLTTKEDFNFDFFGFITAFSKFQTNKTYETLSTFGTKLNIIKNSKLLAENIIDNANIPVVGTLLKGIVGVYNSTYKTYFFIKSGFDLVVNMLTDLVSNMLSFLNVFIIYFMV